MQRFTCHRFDESCMQAHLLQTVICTAMSYTILRHDNAVRGAFSVSGRIASTGWGLTQDDSSWMRGYGRMFMGKYRACGQNERVFSTCDAFLGWQSTVHATNACQSLRCLVVHRVNPESSFSSPMPSSLHLPFSCVCSLVAYLET